MNHRVPFFVTLCSLLLLVASGTHAGQFELSFRKEAAAFVNSLGEDQAKSCLLPLNDKRRWRMQYTGGTRPGLLIGDLDQSQRAALEKTMRLVLSDHGWSMANKVALQDHKDGLGKYWVTCFGDPRKEGNFALRIAEHHLTVVQLEVGKGETKEFGPILLGANPPTLWKADEQAIMTAWKAIATGSKPVLNAGKAVASKAMPEGDGVLFSSLNVDAQKAVKAAWEQRISIFTPAIQKRIDKLFQVRGGWAKARVAFYGEEPIKRCKDGGRWDFKCGVPGMVWDYQSHSGHIHMSLWAK